MMLQRGEVRHAWQGRKIRTDRRGVYLLLESSTRQYSGATAEVMWQVLVLAADGRFDREREGQVQELSDDWLANSTEAFP